MIRAALTGAVDFTKASAIDAGWWRRCNILLDEQSRIEDEDLLGEAYRFHLALMSNSALTDDSFNRSKKGALETFTEIFNLAHPWETTSTRKLRQEQVSRLIDAYEKIFGGSMKDPAFRARVEADVEESRRRNREERLKGIPSDVANRQVIAKARQQQQKRQQRKQRGRR